MDFAKIFDFLLTNFNKYGIRYALMGGFALHAAGYPRMTEDIDVLVLKEDMPKVKNFLLGLGYDLVHESEDVSNFKGRLKELGRIDFLHAHRQYTRNMLKRAKEYGILQNAFKAKVIVPEDIIGLKVQASANDQSRYKRDMADIEQLLRIHQGSLKIDLLKEYFALFGKEDELTELLKRTQDA